MQVQVVYDTNIWFYLVIIMTVVLAIYAILKSFSFNSDNRIMEREYTTSMKGLMAMLVLFSHFASRIDNLWFPFKLVRNMGFPAVAVFLFISGYAETVQLRKKSNAYFTHFISRKLGRLYSPWVISTLLFAVLCEVSFTELCKGLFSFKTIYREDTYNWFIIFILFCYLLLWVYGIIFKNSIGEDTRKLSCILLVGSILWLITCLVLKKSSNWYINSFSFLLGNMFASADEKFIKRCRSKLFLLVSALGALFFLLLPMIMLSRFRDIIWMIDTMFVAVFVFLLSLYTNMSSKIFKTLGNLSLDIFLMGTGVFLIYYTWFRMESISIILVIAVVIVLAKLLNVCSSFITNKIFKR